MNIKIITESWKDPSSMYLKNRFFIIENNGKLDSTVWESTIGISETELMHSTDSKSLVEKMKVNQACEVFKQFFIDKYINHENKPLNNEELSSGTTKGT